MSGGPTILGTARGSRVWRAYAANVTDASITAPVDVLTAPTVGDGVILIPPYANRAAITIYGVASDGHTGAYQVWGTLKGPTEGTSGYVQSILCAGTWTMGTRTGIASGEVLNTELYADTITIGTGYSTQFNDVNSPADNTVATLIVDCRNAKWLLPRINKGNATSTNMLITFF